MDPIQPTGTDTVQPNIQTPTRTHQESKLGDIETGMNTTVPHPTAASSSTTEPIHQPSRTTISRIAAIAPKALFISSFGASLFAFGWASGLRSASNTQSESTPPNPSPTPTPNPTPAPFQCLYNRLF